MKPIQFTGILLSIGLTLSGCGVELLATTAIRGELEAKQAKQAAKQLNYVKGKVGSLNVEQAIQTYRAEKGVNPPSLDALVPTYLPAVPTQPDGSPYPYDPLSGKLTAPLPQSGGPSAADLQLMNDIRAAINRYGSATGYYPPTLDDLYPGYLAQLPRTSSGELFIYNNQNGYLAHPHASSPAGSPSSPTPRRGTMPASGAGPMGEVMTGIGIQQQLGNMNTSGASAARSRAKGGVDGISDQHTNQQNRAMDQLGL